MGKFKDWLAVGLLGASLALGAGSYKGITNTMKKIEADPDYITATDIQNVNNSVGLARESLRHIEAQSSPGGVSYNPSINNFTSNPDYSTSEHLPDPASARANILQAREKLSKLETADPKGRLYETLTRVEKSIPKSHFEKYNFNAQENQLEQVMRDLGKTQGQYRDIANGRYRSELGGWMLAPIVAFAGGAGGLVTLLNRKEQEIKKDVHKAKMTIFTIGIIGICAGLLFASSGISGYSIASLDSIHSNITGAILLVIGFIGLFLGSRKTD
jgi:hypothetical protein